MINKKLLDGWEKKLDKAILTGKGQFASCLVSDIHDFRHIISLLRSDQLEKAAQYVMYSIDTAAAEEVPLTIYKELEKVYYS
jgi:hypothetical protein